ncbi:MAG TPA: HAD family hydrolase [Bryobacteraceae bacterium]|nr:HAD family hydrolase [Bryobacteraceae bacterium]
MESVHPGVSAAGARIVLFDFDGTLSLIRTGWMRVMVPMMVEVLADLKTGETEDELRQVIESFVWRLTGEETIYQMIALASEVTRRGGTPLEPLVYKQRYLDLLSHVIAGRLNDLRRGHCPPDRYLVPGVRAVLEDFKARGFSMYLASGTDEIYLKEEAQLLDVARYFDGGVYGALDDFQKFSKRILVQRILALPGVSGNQLLGFGDGYVEIEEVRRAGGVTVGVATDEPDCQIVDEWKRQRLIGVGADYILPNYLQPEIWMPELFRV